MPDNVQVHSRTTCGDDPLDLWFTFGMKNTEDPRRGKWGKALNPDIHTICELIKQVNDAPWTDLVEGVLIDPCVILKCQKDKQSEQHFGEYWICVYPDSYSSHMGPLLFQYESEAEWISGCYAAKPPVVKVRLIKVNAP